MHKLWTIAWKEIYTTFTDRNLVLIMVASPLVLSTIVALAFGGFGGGDVPIQDIPIALVNHDQAGSLGFSYGDIYASMLIPAEPGGSQTEPALPACETASETEPAAIEASLFDLTETVVFDEPLARSLVESGEVEFEGDAALGGAYLDGVAKAAVDSGVYTAAIIIPSDFTQRMSYIPMLHPEMEQTGVSVYANSGSAIAASVVRSIVEGITNRIASGNIAIAATFEELQATYGPSALAQAASQDLASAFSCAFTPAGDIIHLNPEAVESSSGGDVARSILVWVGSAQAMFFALFTSTFGVLGLHNERRQWTLQRLVVSPTPRSYILAGNLVGVFMTVLFQVSILIIALTAIGSLLVGKLDLVFGNDIPLLVGLLISVAMAVSGFGMLVASVIKSPEQGGFIAPMANIAMGVLGGAFGFILPKAASVFSIIFWGREAFQKLAVGQTDIGVNLMVLLIQGGIMFALGVVLFNRRVEL